MRFLFIGHFFKKKYPLIRSAKCLISHSVFYANNLSLPLFYLVLSKEKPRWSGAVGSDSI